MIFLDRDGVINYNPVYLDYIKKPSEFKFLPGACRAIKMLKDASFEVVVISNQSGTAKGLFTKKDLKAIDKKMFAGLKAKCTGLDGTYYCTHSSESGCACKKPRTGLIRKAVGKARIDHENSFFLGDTQRDMLAGKRYNLKTILLLSGYSKRKDIKSWKIKPDFIAKNLLCAVKEIILKKEGDHETIIG